MGAGAAAAAAADAEPDGLAVVVAVWLAMTAGWFEGKILDRMLLKMLMVVSN